jgi:hypothetical protein
MKHFISSPAAAATGAIKTRQLMKNAGWIYTGSKRTEIINKNTSR